MGQISGVHVLLVLLEILGGVPLYVCVHTHTYLCEGCDFSFLFFLVDCIARGKEKYSVGKCVSVTED